MSISDGITVESTEGHIGYGYGSTGLVTVDGVGSTLICERWLDVGAYGSGSTKLNRRSVVYRSLMRCCATSISRV